MTREGGERTKRNTMLQFLSFLAFTAFVAAYATWQLRKDKLNTSEAYFLGGRSLTGVVIAGSLLLTNISTEHLVGMNGSAYRNGALVISYEVTSAIALVVAAMYFVPRYLKMGLSTIPEFLEKRFDGLTRTLIALVLMLSFVTTLLPIVLYTGAIQIEDIFEISKLLDVSKSEGLWLTVLVVGGLGAIYAIFGGLKMVAHTDTINGYGLLLAGVAVPVIALWEIGDGNVATGIAEVFNHAPEKFRVISDEPSYGEGARDAILPFSVLFTGLIINQLYFWAMHQSIIQRALGAASLKEAQKGLLYTGILKILIPIVVLLPGIIGFYYFGEKFYENEDLIYPALIKKIIPGWMTGLFVAVVVGAVLSTFNSVLNSTATVFSLDVFQRISPSTSERNLVRVGKICSAVLAVFAIGVAPFVANAPEGLYQLLQQLNGIFFVPMATVIMAGFFFKKVSATGAKAGLAFGLAFYILLHFILKVELHFIHIWGLEFVLNVGVMHLVSHYFPRENTFTIQDVGVVDMQQWRFAKPLSVVLVLVTLGIYFALGSL